MHLGVPHNQQYGSVSSLGFGEELAGSTLAADWQQYFDAYDPTKEQMYGQQYQTELGGILEQAGAGVTSLMESWAGAGQVMSGRKGRQRKAIGQESAFATKKLGQGLAQDVYGARESWETQQRSNLNTLLGMDIWEAGSGLPGGGGETEMWEEANQVTCCDGSTVIMATQCGAGNMPWECGDTGGSGLGGTGEGGGDEGGGSPPTGPTDPCPGQYQCPDGSCVGSQLECTG